MPGLATHSYEKSYFYVNKLMNLISFTRFVEWIPHTRLVIENMPI